MAFPFLRRRTAFVPPARAERTLPEVMRRRGGRIPPLVTDLDTALLELLPGIFHSARDAANGIFIAGAIGSGKSSGPGQALAHAYLRAGMGGIVCVAKYTEIELWLEYARMTGRSNSVIIFDHTRCYNFIDHEISRHGLAGLGSIVECLMRVLEAADLAAGLNASAASSDPFWPQSIRMAINYALPVLYSAFGNVTIKMLIDFVVTAATKAEQYVDEQWARGSFAAKALRRCVDDPTVPLPDDMRDAALHYWFKQWPAIPEKTRGNVCISMSAKLDRFNHGVLKDVFCGKTDVLPEMTLGGAIIILAFPVLTMNEDGLIAQALFKHMWQRTVQSRNALPPECRDRLVFEWADECQYFCSVADDMFLSTARDSKCCVVYITQTISSLYARLGKDKTDAVDGLIGKFNTQVFCLNSDYRSNKYASDLIGRGTVYRTSANRSRGWNRSKGMNDGSSANWGESSGGGHGSGPGGWSSNRNSGTNSGSGESWGQNVGKGTNVNESVGYSESLDNILEPNYFATALKTGGPLNAGEVTAVWFKAGACYAPSGGNFIIPRFRQW